MVGFLLSLLSSSLIYADGFSHGAEFRASELRGSVTLICQSTGGQSFISCTDEILDPSEVDKFVVDQKTDASTVVLKAIHEDGKSKEQSRAFNKNGLASKTAFNLWISTLTQRPLLDFGKNAIHYDLKKKNVVMKSGDFVVNVADGGVRECPSQVMYSRDPTNCMDSYAQVCDDYFYDQNYCQ